MIAPLGRILILASLLAAAAGAVVGFAAGAFALRRTDSSGRVVSPTSTRALISSAALLMEYALLVHDFSVGYVAQVGSRSVPTWVTIVSLWSSLEGSILFWGFVLGIYIAGRDVVDQPSAMTNTRPYAIGVWLGCAAFFSFPHRRHRRIRS